MLAELAVCVCAFLVGAEATASPELSKPDASRPPPLKAPKADANKPPPVAPKARIELIAIEKSMVEATNAERARYGLPPLEVDDDLMESARAHCAWMTLNESLQHTRDPVAENIAMGQQSTEEVVDCWMRSPGHRANMLSVRFRRIGVAAYRTPRDVIFWCQQFRH